MSDQNKICRSPGTDAPPCGSRDVASVEATAALTPTLNEPVLADDYPIYAGYLYIADGRVVSSDYHGITARQFKNLERITELRRCDIHGRQAIAKALGGDA